MSNPTCVFDGCDRTNLVARRLCGMHYQRMYQAGRLGEFALPPRPAVPIEARFRRIGWTERVVHPELGACWEWKGSRNLNGYGQISQGRRSEDGSCRPRPAYRVSYKIAHGEIPPRHSVLHSCDNPPCVRPDHLSVGTHKDNSADMVAKRRSRNGERRPQAKLTDAQVDEIRALYATRQFTQKELGRQFGVSDSAVSMIVNYKRRPEKTYPIPENYREFRNRAA